MRVYIFGPMRGYDQLNWPAFDAAADMIRSRGDQPINPAEIDRSDGWTVEKFLAMPSELQASTARKMILRDLAIIEAEAEAGYGLQGWQDSNGANVEHALFRFLNVPVEYQQESILAEAERIVSGPRRNAYGHPYDDYSRTATMMTGILSPKLLKPLTAREAAMCMIAVKLSREVNHPKRDNRVDLAGYAQCLDLIAEREDAMDSMS